MSIRLRIANASELGRNTYIFPDGSSPIIGLDVPAKKDLRCRKVKIIGHQMGINIIKPNGYYYFKKKKFHNQKQAKNWVRNNLEIPISRNQLKELGFIRVNKKYKKRD